MDDDVQFAVLVPESLMADLKALAASPRPESDFEIKSLPAEQTESAMGFDPVITPTLLWAVFKFAGAGVAGGVFSTIGRRVFEKLQGESSNKQMFEMTVRLPDGSRISLKSTDNDAMAEFAKKVMAKQRGKRK